MKFEFRKQLCLAVSLVAVFACDAAEKFEAAVWRGETAYVEIPKEFQNEVASICEQANSDDVKLELLSFDEVKYDLSELKKNKKGRAYREITGKASAADVCRPWKKGETPSMVKIIARPNAKPGKRIIGNFELTIVDRVLPPAKDWKYFLDLWQHPWAVSRYFNVKPFSKEHYAKMEPIWRALAECGCKALTVTLLDLPWNHQCCSSRAEDSDACCNR